MIEITDADLLLRMTNFEDHFVERKTSGDSKDWLKTVVGFANSAPIGWPAVLYIGVRDGGDIEGGLNLDTLQKTLGKKLEDAYPPIYYMTKVLVKDGKQFLAIIIPGSEDGPHFAGPSCVRVGSETKIASEPQFQELIAQRQSKAYEILKWKGKQATVDYMRTEYIHSMGPVDHTRFLRVDDCTGFYVMLCEPQTPTQLEAIPLNRVNISFDTAKKQLKLEVLPN